MIYGQLSRVEAMYGFIAIGKETFREIPSKAGRHKAEYSHPFCAICSKRLYRTRELESWVPNLTRPKDRAMQDGAEAIKIIRGCPIKNNACHWHYKPCKGLMCLEREYYEKGKAVMDGKCKRKHRIVSPPRM